ncbi:ABC transporter ATP-binding protein [Amphiplicatus metriothermophilus]|uniref:Phospholipid/cholesterol/gamma-HCH transport system ATP-binding protein n=1 Tax=Amphiplicatus metriothermophilus TaxID=1519374 RepID=A0A239PQ95_9PROT|nr:ATP-binding cassette domain-containing protein [Amphiplicatus metriothermophilus]MBB5518384.1 phospholipid/cholesterol/gamma-HCH transport system ATP-binding protein [Amphiplicatus metriothermophilus]SNT72451.1 phospholipid/cholesterol/gamma-HCH transport system ATP-binding protein [Amphiplicatus metriothermophilus]
MTENGSHTEKVIEVRGLKTQFGDTVIHENLDLDVHQGEILGVVGGSGTGKSVLMRAIIGLKRPSAGSIRVFGVDYLEADEETRLGVERRWGVLFQAGALFSSLTVAQNVMAPIMEHLHPPRALAVDIAAMKISMAGLPADAGAKYPAELSGGMQKRAALARALALDPELLFLDEPTAGLDPIGAAKFDELIVNLKRSLGLTVFMVTHDLDTLHAACDRVAVLAEKRVIACGSICEVRANPHPWIQEYFGGVRGRAALASKGVGADAARQEAQ